MPTALSDLLTEKNCLALSNALTDDHQHALDGFFRRRGARGYGHFSCKVEERKNFF